MLDDTIFEKYGIDSFINTISTIDVPLLNVIKITKLLYTRLDIIMLKYYNGNMKYLPIVLSFNKITDPVEMKIGMVFELPDIDTIINNITISEILSDENPSNVPGVNNTVDSKIINKNIAYSKNNKTTASPKLNITVETTSYDSFSGTLKF